MSLPGRTLATSMVAVSRLFAETAGASDVGFSLTVVDPTTLVSSLPGVVIENTAPNRWSIDVGAAGITTLDGESTNMAWADVGPGEANYLRLLSGTTLQLVSDFPVAQLPAGMHCAFTPAPLAQGVTCALGSDSGAVDDYFVTILESPPPADLAITKTDGSATATPGSTLTYTIVVSNAGPNHAPADTRVTDILPAVLYAATWMCVGSGGAICTASGAGDINDTIYLPVGATATYTVNATVAADATGTITNAATVAAGSVITDPNPADNAAIDTDTIFVPPPPDLKAIPALSEWGLIILASAIAFLRFAALCRRNNVSR